MKRGSPGGLWPVLCAGALGLCLPGTSLADAVLPLCALTGLRLDGSGACQVAPAGGGPASKLEIKAQANDHGFFWAPDSERGNGAGDLALTTSEAIDRSISFQASGLSTGFGEIDVRGGVGTTKSSDALTFQRLRWGDSTRQDNTSIGVGLVERIFDGRLTIASNLAWSSDKWAWQNGDAPIEFSERTGAARWLSVDAKIIQTDAITWSIKSESSAIDDGFEGTGASWQGGGLTVRGDRTEVSTQFAGFGVSGSGSFDHVENLLFDRTKRQAMVEVDGISATVYATDNTRFSRLEPGQWANRTDARGVTLDMTPSSLAPDLASSPLVPRLVSLSFERGHIVLPGEARDDTSAYQVLADWKTALGTTTALYWSETQGHEAAGAGYLGDRSQMFDLTQGFSVGQWRLSVGATATAFANSNAEDGFADNAISGRFSIRYAPEHGPQFEASLGRTHDQFDMLLDDLLQRSQATRLSLSLDLSDYLQRQLDRPDTHLSLDFRHEMREAEFEVDLGMPPDAISRNTDTVLATFGTPL